MKILGVVGARPQFVKAAVISRAIAAWNEVHEGELQEVLVHTGQHHDDNMSDVFFRELNLAVPRHHLGVAGGMHGEMTGRMLERLEKVLVPEAPAGGRPVPLGSAALVRGASAPDSRAAGCCWERRAGLCHRHK